LKKAIDCSDLFITISKEMSEIYKDIFGKESILAFNMPESYQKDYNDLEKNKNNYIRLVYAGGLYHKRYKVLNLLGNALARYNYNNKNKKRAFLEIYCSSQPSKNILNKINVGNGSSYCGSLNERQLAMILNSCDIPVYAESFDRGNITSTRLSFSTKIPGYLVLDKCILAIGPEVISSMKYLKNVAFCITNPKEIYTKLQEILNDEEKQKHFAVLAQKLYEESHNNKKTRDMLISNILRIYGT
jgi:hypothetical protein